MSRHVYMYKCERAKVESLLCVCVRVGVIYIIRLCVVRNVHNVPVRYRGLFYRFERTIIHTPENDHGNCVFHASGRCGSGVVWRRWRVEGNDAVPNSMRKRGDAGASLLSPSR